jgi:protein involved in polysaccharide export with SLBB domain
MACVWLHAMAGTHAPIYSIIVVATLALWAIVVATMPSRAGAAAGDRPPNRLEAFYTERTGEGLRQYGYRLFEGLTPEAARADRQPAGALPDDYLVGVGDRFAVTMRGREDRREVAVVDRSGRLVLPYLPPIPAAGRTLEALRAAVDAEAAARLGATEIYLSVSEVRQIAVLAIGEVSQPGRFRLTAFATALDALAAAGGATRQGSLRAIRLVRAGETRTVDLYDLLGGGDAPEIALRDGDRVVVPPLGATVAVAGAVRRPGIYELPPGEPQIPAQAALALAGGPAQPGPVAVLRQRIGEDGVDRTRPVGPLDGAVVSDGDVLRVEPRLAAPAGEVRLTGHVAAPGPYALTDAPTLAALVGDRALLGDTPYLPFAALERRDPRSGARVLHPVDLAAVLAGRADRPLVDGDRVIVLSTRDVGFLASRVVLTLLRGGRLSGDDLARCAGLAALARAVGPEGDPRLRDGRLAEAARRLTPVPAACPTVMDRFPDLLPLAVARSVVLREGVSRPGFYPAASTAALRDLVALAGGEAVGAARVLERPGAAVARPGETVTASPPQIALIGPVDLPGWRDLATAPSLARLLGDGEMLEPGVYPLFGLVVRRPAGTAGERLLVFSPARVIAGEADEALQDGDRVRLFAVSEAVGPPGGAADGASAGADPASQAAVPAADRRTGRPAASRPPARPAPAGAGHRIPTVDAARLSTLLDDHAVVVSGAVARPGSYPVADAATLARLIEAAGGITRRGDRAALEIVRENAAAGRQAEGATATARFAVDLTWQNPETVLLRPGDAMRVPTRYDPVVPAAVTVRGEVMHPGTYPLVRGERLSDLIERAGGPTPDAYPDGAVFTRAVERQRRAAEFRRRADDLERRLAARLLDGEPPGAGEVARARELIAELRTVEPPGRVVVEADPEMLALHPERDPLLAPGDALHMPQRSLSVRVAGEVLSPASLPFRSGLGVDDYIRAAGGFTRFADRDRVFLVYPDGSAEPVAESLWRFTPVAVPPGSTVVVPLDPEPFDFLALTESIAGVLGRIALTAASIAVIGE